MGVKDPLYGFNVAIRRSKGGIYVKLKYVLTILSLTLIIVSIPLSSLANQTGEAGNHDAMIREIMEEMALEEKVGQLFIVHVYGKTPTDPAYELINIANNRGGKDFQEVIENYHIGGVIYFNWTDNIGTPLDVEQVNALSNGLQDIALEQDQEIPLFISTDQEGGIVQRATRPATVFPGNMALGAARLDNYAAQTGSILGKELEALGVNMNFAPTVDVNLNPENPVIGVRSFGEDPDRVSRLGVEQIEALQGENVIATAKHFPGHGDTDVDSHYGLPIIDHDLETLHAVDLKPFKDAIDAGVDAIMTGHIVVPALDDSGLPATLSKPILTELLREEMGFDGLIITDSLDMSGADVLPPEEVPVEAFKAGADILLNPANVEEAYTSVLEAVQSGEISEDRLNESVYRILQSKAEKGLFEDPYADPANLENIGTEANLQTAKEIAEKSITLVKNEQDVLPVSDAETVLVTGPSVAKPGLIADLLDDKGIKSDSFATATSPTAGQIDQAVELADTVDKVIITTYTANTNSQQQALVEALQATGKPIVVSAHRNPYDVMAFPDVDSYVASYSYLDVSMEAVAGVLAGEINPFGSLPVTIPGHYEIGEGLDYVDIPRSAAGMKQLVDQLDEAGEISNEEASRALNLHLTAVAQYEDRRLPDKVIKHLEGFRKLLDQQQVNEAISKKAHSYLDTEGLRLIEHWLEN